jgi:hypothetical protein
MSWHGPILSRSGAPKKPGAVQELEAGALEPDRVDAPGSLVKVDCEQALGRAGEVGQPMFEEAHS